MLDTNTALVKTFHSRDERYLQKFKKLSQMNERELDLMGKKGLLLAKTEFDRDKLISKLEKWMQDLASGKGLC